MLSWGSGSPRVCRIDANWMPLFPSPESQLFLHELPPCFFFSTQYWTVIILWGVLLDPPSKQNHHPVTKHGNGNSTIWFSVFPSYIPPFSSGTREGRSNPKPWTYEHSLHRQCILIYQYIPLGNDGYAHHISHCKNTIKSTETPYMQSETMIPGYFLGCVESQVGLDSPKTPFSVQFSARLWPIALALADGSCEVLHGGAPKSSKIKPWNLMWQWKIHHL